MKTFAVYATVLAGFAAGPLYAQAMTPAEYVMTAGASDLYEIQSSQIVLQSTQNPNVLSFAQTIISDHTKSTGEVKAAAMKSHGRLAPPKLMPLQTELIAELVAEKGPARDAAYIAQQKASHNQALDVQKAYATDGTAPALKATTAAIVPIVMQHVAMLKTM